MSWRGHWPSRHTTFETHGHTVNIDVVGGTHYGPGASYHLVLLCRDGLLRDQDMRGGSSIGAGRSRRRWSWCARWWTKAERWQHFIHLRFFRFGSNQVQPECVGEPGADVARSHHVARLDASLS